MSNDELLDETIDRISQKLQNVSDTVTSIKENLKLLLKEVAGK
jgi:hypothetical protein